MPSFDSPFPDEIFPKVYVGLFGDNSVAVLDTACNHVLTTIPIPAGPHGLVMAPDGKRVYARSDGAAVVSVVSTATDEVVANIDVGSMPHGLAITPDGRRVLVAGFGSNTVAAVDTHTNTIVWRTAVAQPHNLSITPDGRTAYAASQMEGHPALVIIDVASGTQRGSIPLNHTPRALTVTPDGEEVYFTEADVDAVLVLDRATNEIVTRIPVGSSPHYPLFTPDGNVGMVVAQRPWPSSRHAFASSRCCWHRSAAYWTATPATEWSWARVIPSPVQTRTSHWKPTASPVRSRRTLGAGWFQASHR